MAIPFLSRAVVQQITQRVLSNVLEQLPTRVGQSQPSQGPPTPANELARINALALREFGSHLRRVEASHAAVDARVGELERRAGWRSYARILATGLLTYALGFATAVILRALGWIG